MKRVAPVGCDCCQNAAVFWFGRQPLCYFCARQIVFDLHRKGKRLAKLVLVNPKAKF